MHCVNGPVKHCWLYYNTETHTYTMQTSRALCSFACVCSTSIILPPLCNHTQAQTHMHAHGHRHTRAHQTPCECVSAKSDGRLPAKMGAVIGVKAHLLGLASYSHTHTNTRTLTQLPFRLTGFISSTRPPTPGCRSHAGVSGVLAVCMWNDNVFSCCCQTGAELHSDTANEISI